MRRRKIVYGKRFVELLKAIEGGSVDDDPAAVIIMAFEGIKELLEDIGPHYTDVDGVDLARVNRALVSLIAAFDRWET